MFLIFFISLLNGRVKMKTQAQIVLVLFRCSFIKRAIVLIFEIDKAKALKKLNYAKQS